MQIITSPNTKSERRVKRQNERQTKSTVRETDAEGLAHVLKI